MRIVADESVDFLIIESLRRAGFEVFSILEELPGCPDEEVLATARRLEAYLITEDKDFGELTYRLKKPSYGILLLRMPAEASETKATQVLDVIQKIPGRLWGKFSVLELSKLRIREMKP